MSAKIELVLYSGPHCRLCDEAEEMLWPLLDREKFDYRKIDVTQSLELKKRYGLKIPVLGRADSAAELDWPFDVEQLRDFL